MPTADSAVRSADVAHAWAEALAHVAACPGREARSLVVKISVAGGTREDGAIRQIADRHLARHSLSPIATVANTIFPRNLWVPSRPAKDLFDRYERIWPRVKRYPANAHGTYFRRFTCFGGEDCGVNQIEHVVATWKRGNHRRSALQLAVFDPSVDHTDQRQRGFPCLHQVALVAKGGELGITAFYAMQTVFEKAYGNYLGLVRLGEFLAHEMELRLTDVTCVAAVAKFSQVPTLLKAQRETLLAEIHNAVDGEAE